MQDKQSFIGRRPEETIQKPSPAPALYQKGKTVGTSGATLDLSRMLEYVMKDEQTFPYLPKNLQNGLRKIYRMSENAFNYSSEEMTASQEMEAFLGMGGPAARLRGLKDYINKAMSSGDLPKPVLDALLNAHETIGKELETPQKAPTEREQRREQREEQKRENVIQQYTKKEEVGRREDNAIDRLKKMLGGSTHYKDVFQALPYEIRTELQKLSIDPENLKYLASPRAVFASRSIVEAFLQTQF